MDATPNDAAQIEPYISPPAPNRRRAFRVAAPQLSLKAWRMDPYERLIDRPLPSRRLVLSTVDLARSGAGVVMPSPAPDANGKPSIAVGDRWRLEVPIDGVEERLLVEGRVVALRELTDGRCRVGLAFQDQLSANLIRRADEAIHKLLARLERESIRRSNSAAPAA